MPQVRDLMTSNLFACRVTQTLDKVLDFMKKGRIRHVPILDDQGELVGLVTHRDLLQACVMSFQVTSKETLEKFLKSKPVGQVMRTQIISTTPDTDLKDAAALMQQKKLGCLPVMEGKKLVGILTEADFLNLAWEAVDTEKSDGEGDT